MTTESRHPLLITLDRLTYRIHRTLGLIETPTEQNLGELPPWVSPNVWEYVTEAYSKMTAPSVFEYGTGASSIWHVRNLAALNGSYTAVEHDPNWHAVVYHVLRQEEDIATVLLRETTGTWSGDGDATRFTDYIGALNRPYDVVIVDGRARVACVNHVLDNNLVKPGGLLALMDAGRGLDGWMGRPASTGTSDYQPAVRRMLDAGGVMLDGTGFDNWPGWRRRAGVNARYYPAEACVLKFAP